MLPLLTFFACFSLALIGAIFFALRMRRRAERRRVRTDGLEVCPECGSRELTRGMGYVYRLACCEGCGAMYQREPGTDWRLVVPPVAAEPFGTPTPEYERAALSGERPPPGHRYPNPSGQ